MKNAGKPRRKKANAAGDQPKKVIAEGQLKKVIIGAEPKGKSKENNSTASDTAPIKEKKKNVTKPKETIPKVDPLDLTLRKRLELNAKA